MMHYAPEHQRAAMPLHKLIVVIFGVLAFFCLIGGVIAIIWNAKSETKFEIFGAQLTTGHVGVAFVGVGLLTAYFTVRAVLKNQRDLAGLQSKGDSENNNETVDLSGAEREILLAAAQEGVLHLLTVDAFGTWVRAGKIDFFDQTKPAVQARYLDAFESLQGRGYIRPEGGSLFRLTGRGFEQAQQLSKMLS